MNRKLLYGILFLVVLLVTLYLKRSTENEYPEAKLDRYATNLIYTKHAKCRMSCRDITEEEISHILKYGEVNMSKSEPDGKPDPKYAVEGYSNDRQHLRVIFAPSTRGMVVITCIDLEKEWKCDCR
jgi:hypothetical protein